MYVRRLTFVAVATMAGSGLFAGLAAADTVPSITTVAGNGTRGASGDGGPAVNAELNTPNGVAGDLAGNLYVADTGNNKVRKIVNPTAIHVDIISTIAGTGVPGHLGDGGLASSAQLRQPTGVAIDSNGDVFVADSGNNRVREINTAGIISTFAGTGQCQQNGNNGNSGNNGKKNGSKKKTLGNGGPASQASLCDPTGIAVDHAGDLFISDTGHDTVREVPNGGPIVAFAGTGKAGFKGDGGPAVDARFKSPTGLAINALGDVYIADTNNDRVRVVTPNGIISTFLGGGSPGHGHNADPPRHRVLNRPTGLGVDPSGDVFIADTGNNRIQEVSTSLEVTTVAGTGRAGFSGDGGPATAAELNEPLGIVADASAVYFADARNQRVRGIFSGAPPVLPQTALTILLPMSAGLLIAAAAVVVRRRRRPRPAVS
jgi:sugar lactone lactonase YvrE